VTAERDTIAAIATPVGRGGIGVLRCSGPAVPSLARALLGELPTPRHARFSRFRDVDGQPIDHGIALYFPAPHSFTGEHVLELHGHGGLVTQALLLERLLQLGARHARPGEFSERAFLEGKLDLAQAEAVADLIAAGSEQAARAAMRSLEGEFSRAVNELAAALLALRTYVEAAIDFPDEEVDFLASPEVAARVADIDGRFQDLRTSARQGRLLRDGLHVVIAGRPNAGKSSLLNALAGHPAAIVTDIPGTTRDLLREHLHIDGLPIHLVDTAGLRESADPIEAEGIRRAQAEIRRADLILYVVDASGRPTSSKVAEEVAALPEGVAVMQVWNKCDLEPAPAGVGLPVSAITGEGIAALKAAIHRLAGYETAGGSYSARQRHLDALARSQGHVDEAQQLLSSATAFELVAEELRLAHRALGEITGEVTSDDLLGEIFASFCIGK
jgi:tRNA modification GTPase